MSITWVDFILLATAVLVIMLEMKRGFGKALFDFTAALIALKLVTFAYNGASASYEFIADAATNRAFVYIGLFVVIGGICWSIGKLAYDHTLISMEMFDPVLGMVLGVGTAVVIGHAFTGALAIIGTVNGHLPMALTQSTLGLEFYDFQTYYNVIATLSKLAA